jgi:hypothetical protein
VCRNVGALNLALKLLYHGRFKQGQNPKTNLKNPVLKMFSFHYTFWFWATILSLIGASASAFTDLRILRRQIQEGARP